MNKLQEAIATRDAYLEEHPELKPFQDEIDSILEKCKPEDRQDALLLMLAGKLTELRDGMNKLKEMLPDE